MAGGGGGGGRGGAEERERPTGRGTADDAGHAAGARRPSEIPEEPHAEDWEATPLTDEQLRNPVNVIPPARGRAWCCATRTRMSCWCRGCWITAANWRSTRR